jgi:hypothetical protein
MGLALRTGDRARAWRASEALVITGLATIKERHFFETQTLPLAVAGTHQKASCVCDPLRRVEQGQRRPRGPRPGRERALAHHVPRHEPGAHGDVRPRRRRRRADALLPPGRARRRIAATIVQSGRRSRHRPIPPPEPLRNRDGPPRGGTETHLGTAGSINFSCVSSNSVPSREIVVVNRPRASSLGTCHLLISGPPGLDVRTGSWRGPPRRGPPR